MDPAHNLAVQTEVIRHAAGVRRHLRRLLVSGAALRREHGGVLLAPERVPLRSPGGGQARVLGAAGAARSPSWTCGPWTRCGSGLAGTAAGADGERAVSNPRAAVTNLASQAGAARRVAWPARAEAVGRRRQGRLARGAAPGRGRARRVRQRRPRTRSGACGGRCARRRASESQMREQQQFYRTEWAIEHELEALVTRGRRLVVGPWLSEVGFEALYWVPFLHWLKTAFHLDPGRVVAVSRGGVARLVRGRGRPVRRDLGPHRSGRVRPPQRRARRHQAATSRRSSTARSWTTWRGSSARATST